MAENKGWLKCEPGDGALECWIAPCCTVCASIAFAGTVSRGPIKVKSQVLKWRNALAWKKTAPVFYGLRGNLFTFFCDVIISTLSWNYSMPLWVVFFPRRRIPARPIWHVLRTQMRARRNICSYRTDTARHACWGGGIGRRLSRSRPGAAKEVSATTGNAGALPARLAALPMNGAFVKDGSEDTWEGCN